MLNWSFHKMFSVSYLIKFLISFSAHVFTIFLGLCLQYPWRNLNSPLTYLSRSLNISMDVLYTFNHRCKCNYYTVHISNTNTYRDSQYFNITTNQWLFFFAQTVWRPKLCLQCLDKADYILTLMALSAPSFVIAW